MGGDVERRRGLAAVFSPWLFLKTPDVDTGDLDVVIVAAGTGNRNQLETQIRMIIRPSITPYINYKYNVRDVSSEHQSMNINYQDTCISQ